MTSDYSDASDSLFVKTPTSEDPDTSTLNSGLPERELDSASRQSGLTETRSSAEEACTHLKFSTMGTEDTQKRPRRKGPNLPKIVTVLTDAELAAETSNSLPKSKSPRGGRIRSPGRTRTRSNSFNNSLGLFIPSSPGVESQGGSSAPSSVCPRRGSVSPGRRFAPLQISHTWPVPGGTPAQLLTRNFSFGGSESQQQSDKAHTPSSRSPWGGKF